MRASADVLEFERAARLRDRLTAVRKAIEKQQMVTERPEDLDIFGIVEDELEAAVQVFYVRRGRVVGRKGFIVDKVEDLVADPAGGPHPRAALRRGADGCSPLIIVPDEPEDLETLEAWLALERSGGDKQSRNEAVDADVEWWAATGRYRVERSVNPTAAPGMRVEIRVPQRGDKQGAARDGHPQRRRGVRPPPPEAGRRPQRPGPGAQRPAGRPRPPRGPAAHRVLRHEPHPGHRTTSARWWSWRTACPGRASTAASRSRAVDQNDDYAAMEEVLTRRLTAYLVEREKPVEERRRRFAYPPQLLLVDGGKGQLGGRPAGRGAPGPRGRDPGRVAGEAVRGGVRSWAGRPDPDPPHLRGPLPPAAHPRRGPPLRHHLPPPAPGPANDRIGARRRPRPRTRPAANGC